MEDRLDVESKRVLVLAPTGRDSVAACALAGWDDVHSLFEHRGAAP